jgi:hypothetical protein
LAEARDAAIENRKLARAGGDAARVRRGRAAAHVTDALQRAPVRVARLL